MELDFFDELPTVFNILKFNPGAVVDDTAIERLLSWLEEMSEKKESKLIDKSLDFFQSDEIWMDSMTLSFALRFAGFVGFNYVKSEDKIRDIVKDILLRITAHKQFSEATVQYGFYKCLNSLSKDITWYEFLNGFMTTTFRTFKTSYLFVQKAAVEFFASLMHTLLKDNSDKLIVVLKTIESITDPKQLYQIVESILLVSKKNLDMFLKFLSTDKLIKKLMSFIETSEDNVSCCQLLESLSSLFSILTKPESNVNWRVTLSSDCPEELLIDFLKILKNKSELKSLVPSFCQSLMFSHAQDCFSSKWNYILLQFALSDIACHESLNKEFENEYLIYHDSVTSPKMWKNILVIVLGEMIKIESKIQLDPMCSKLLLSWKHYCLTILTISLSNDSERHVIDNNLITIMHDKKVPRLCFRYLKDTGFHLVDKELNKEFLYCLWNCLFCITDNPQVICSTLELLSKYISQNKSSLVELFDYSNTNINPVIHNATYSLSDILNKLLWDTNWEVQDSLIDVLLTILEKAKCGTDICHNFLMDNVFWVKVIDLINNQESYIRAKTVAFVGEIALYIPTWEKFCINGNHTLLGVITLLEEIFTCKERQDDMFTRRSIVQVLKLWVQSKQEHLTLFLLNPENSSADSNNLMKCLLNIIENGSRDFDWEVRKLMFTLWVDIANAIAERTDEKEYFIDLIVDNNFGLVLCNGICDCEYLVKVEAYKCLKIISDNFLHSHNVEVCTELKTNLCVSIQTITEYEDTLIKLKSMNRNEFNKLLGNTNLDEIENQIDVLDIKVSTDPVSFIQDVIASARQSEANLLDCY